MRAHDHPLYPTWSGMKQRCVDPNRDNFAYYGGRRNRGGWSDAEIIAGCRA